METCKCDQTMEKSHFMILEGARFGDHKVQDVIGGGGCREAQERES